MKTTKKMYSKLGLAGLLYLLFLALYLFSCTLSLFDGLLFEKSRTQQLTLQDFELVNIQQNLNGELVALTEDPQLVLKTPITHLNNLKYTFKTESAVGEACAFYAKDIEQGYSTRRCVWASRKDNVHSYQFNNKSNTHLRIDATNIAGSRFFISDITINYPLNFYEYFVPSYTEIFYFLLLPIMAAAIISYLRQVFSIIRKKA